MLHHLSTQSLPVHDGTPSLLVESVYNGDKERLGTEKRGDLTRGRWRAWVGAQKRSWGVWKKGRGIRLGAFQNNCELMQLSRTQEDKTNQRRQQAERFSRSMGTEEEGH